MYYLLIILILFTALYLWWRFFFFFRDPERTPPEGNNILSPADGTIVYIKKIKKNIIPISIKNKKEIKLEELTHQKNFLNKNYFLIGIFMHPTSVHVNRAPIKGKITFQKYISNKKNLPMTLMWMRTLFNFKPYEKYSKHILENERNITTITGPFPVTIIQIADIYVNKIVSFVKKENNVKKGQRIGIIKMGSQVDLLLPYDKNLNIKIKKGQKVKAGESILAEY
jgi:phosphatidylserine decarboxylase